MDRAYNFSPGPAMMPVEVLEQARKDLLNFGATGMSVMEMSHRGAVFEGINARAEALLRELMGIGRDFAVLFLQGGASMQFAMAPMNLLVASADYVDSGNFAHNAIVEAQKLGTVRIVASSREDGYTYVPTVEPRNLDPQADYLHITTNNTIYGTRLTALPACGAVPLAADMSSNILAEPYDVNQFGLIYAGAQKNMGCAGVTVVIIRRDLLERAPESLPSMLQYRVHAKNSSLFNTPSSFSIYMMMLTLQWVKDQGGVEEMEKRSIQRSSLLYDALDRSDYYRAVAHPSHRSRMNITFRLPSEELDDRFAAQAAQSGLTTLKGHRLTGGIRANLYNAMPQAGVEALVRFMEEFERNNPA